MSGVGNPVFATIGGDASQATATVYDGGLGSLADHISSRVKKSDVGKPNGVAALDENGGILIGTLLFCYQDAQGNLIIPSLPTTDPGVPGAVWDNGGAIFRSKGV